VRLFFFTQAATTRIQPSFHSHSYSLKN